MKGNFHVQFGIGGGEGDLSADHTGNNDKAERCSPPGKLFIGQIEYYTTVNCREETPDDFASS
jgi:hypothetical protein